MSEQHSDTLPLPENPSDGYGAGAIQILEGTTYAPLGGSWAAKSWATA